MLDTTTQPIIPPDRSGATNRGAITLSGITRIFAGTVPAVDGVDLNIEAGEFFTLLGPSGCGKTTLLRMGNGAKRSPASPNAAARLQGILQTDMFTRTPADMELLQFTHSRSGPDYKIFNDIWTSILQ